MASMTNKSSLFNIMKPQSQSTCEHAYYIRVSFYYYNLKNGVRSYADVCRVSYAFITLLEVEVHAIVLADHDLYKFIVMNFAIVVHVSFRHHVLQLRLSEDFAHITHGHSQLINAYVAVAITVKDPKGIK